MSRGRYVAVLQWGLRLHIGQAVLYISDGLLDYNEELCSTRLIRNTEGRTDKRGQ